MGSDALRYPIADCLYQMIRSSGQPIIKRVNLAGIMVSMLGASRREDPVYEDIKKLKDSLEVLRSKYMKAYDLSSDDLPQRATFEHLLYEFIEDALAVVTKERLISGSIMERLAGERFKTKEREEE